MPAILLFLALAFLALAASLLLAGWLARFALRGGFGRRDGDMGYLTGD